MEIGKVAKYPLKLLEGRLNVPKSTVLKVAEGFELVKVAVCWPKVNEAETVGVGVGLGVGVGAGVGDGIVPEYGIVTVMERAAQVTAQTANAKRQRATIVTANFVFILVLLPKRKMLFSIGS